MHTSSHVCLVKIVFPCVWHAEARFFFFFLSYLVRIRQLNLNAVMSGETLVCLHWFWSRRLHQSQQRRPVIKCSFCSAYNTGEENINAGRKKYCRDEETQGDIYFSKACSNSLDDLYAGFVNVFMPNNSRKRFPKQNLGLHFHWHHTKCWGSNI